MLLIISNCEKPRTPPTSKLARRRFFLGGIAVCSASFRNGWYSGWVQWWKRPSFEGLGGNFRPCLVPVSRVICTELSIPVNCDGLWPSKLGVALMLERGICLGARRRYIVGSSSHKKKATTRKWATDQLEPNAGVLYWSTSRRKGGNAKTIAFHTKGL